MHIHFWFSVLAFDKKCYNEIRFQDEVENGFPFIPNNNPPMASRRTFQKPSPPPCSFDYFDIVLEMMLFAFIQTHIYQLWHNINITSYFSFLS